MLKAEEKAEWSSQCNIHKLKLKNGSWASLVAQWLKANLPPNVGDTDLIPDPGRSHMPWSK